MSALTESRRTAYAIGVRSQRSPCSLGALVVLLAAGCASTSDNAWLGVIDLGDDVVAPDLALDEEMFVCRIQPEVLTRHSCATGMSGEGGGCHDSRSALRLLDASDDPPCDAEGRIVRTVPDAYMRNFDALRFAVQSSPEDSPLYLRPVGRAPHPRVIFEEDDPAAELIAEWISRGGS
jgi:hypothetical protein